ncbi:MAG TPA: tetratricopeptide repeat protein [Thermomicrobiales bacterium]|nr:tetratricopeptide repeat protein [Thermomicrobiales bacterium]
MDAAHEFGDLLREYRDRAGLTQEQLAEPSGLSGDAIGLLERGARRRPHRHTLQQLGAALGLADQERAALETAARSGARTSGPASHAALPAPSTSFVGRAAEVADLVRLLDDPERRLVTLTGPGGVGKTRLAIEVAGRTAARFSDDVVYLPLAPIRDPELVGEAVSRALGFDLGALTAATRERRALLVLDNCEHLPSAGPVVVALLAALPRLVVLATSRAPLRLSAEQQYPVSPLDARDPGVLLFAARARAVALDFALIPENVDAVAAICRRVDGLPLAIELAAAWVKVLPPEALLARLTRVLPLLDDGPRDLPERHQTLRAAIGWSEDLLTDAERALFRLLSVFDGGWTLEAAETVGGPDGSPVLPTLARLVDASLVQLERASVAEPRYAMLETVREYAAELLAASGEEDATRDRHAAWLLAMVEEAQQHLVGPDEAIWMARLEVESPNLRVALRREIGRRNGDAAIRFAAVLWRFWAGRGRLDEGRRWLEEILALATAAGPDVVAPLRRAMLMHVAANLARVQGDYLRAEALYRECLAIRRAHDDRPGIVAALHNLAIVASDRRDYAAAFRLYDEALAIGRELDNRYGIAFGLTSYGETMQATGDLARAVALYEEGLAGFRSIEHAWGISLALTRLGDAILEQGDAVRAAALQRESLAISAGLGDPRSLVDALEGLARAIAGSDPDRAARLVGAAETLRARFGCPRPPNRRDAHAATVAALHATLGDAAAAFAEGNEAAAEDDLPALVAWLEA